MSDKIKFKILEDGTLSITTDQISRVNHMSADEFLKDLFKVMGGKVEVEKRKPAQQHEHIHEHEHEKE